MDYIIRKLFPNPILTFRLYNLKYGDNIIRIKRYFHILYVLAEEYGGVGRNSPGKDTLQSTKKKNA